MDYKDIENRIDKFFKNVDPDDLLNEFIELGYEVEFDVRKNNDNTLEFAITELEVPEEKIEHVNKIMSQNNGSFNMNYIEYSYELAA